MRTIGLEDISEADFSSEERLVMDMIRTKYPRLDLRRGTVLRDLLVMPDSAVGAAFSMQAAEQRDCASLLRLSERSEAGESVDAEDVSAILSNFNMEPVSGTKASGNVRITVAFDRMYTVARDAVLRTMDGVSFRVVSETTASATPSSGEAVLRKGAQGYWFLVPVECADVGVAGNIGPGTALTPEFELFGFVSASAYRLFSGGSDMEPIGTTVSRIRQSLSMRGLLTRDSVEAALRDRLDGTDNPVVAVSVCGYGSAAQLRDKHNLFGVAVGGRVDVYVRNFTGLPVAEVTKAGSAVDGEEGVYSVSIGADEVPGMYCVYRVTNPTADALSSYPHSETWADSGSSSTWHDFDTSSSTRELMGTVWRGLEVRVDARDSDVARDGDGNPLFRVEVVRLPAAASIQSAVDDDSVRATGLDYVVRCPVVVQVSVSARVRHPYGVPFDRDLAVERVCDYINTSGFAGRLTRSEVASILMGLGATSVDLSGTDGMLSGFGYDADGGMFVLSGDALDVADVKGGAGRMVSKETCVFSVEPSNVSITTVVD